MNATTRPSAEIEGASTLPPAASRSVVPNTRSRRYRSTSKPPTRTASLPRKATKRPSPEIAGAKAPDTSCVPSGATDTSSVPPIPSTPRTNTSTEPLLSPMTRFDALDANAITRPSSETSACRLSSACGAPKSGCESQTVCGDDAAPAAPPTIIGTDNPTTGNEVLTKAVGRTTRRSAENKLKVPPNSSAAPSVVPVEGQRC